MQPFLVSGNSMRPNFSDGDYLIIDQLTYRIHEPQRGDVVVFRYPNDPSTYFIKRIIGTPGEEVRIAGGKVAIINTTHPNGFILNEPYLGKDAITGHDGEYVVKSGEYFVMGDNRAFSFDSRNWGLLEKKLIIGLVRFRLWPLQALAYVPALQYQ
jgi:signal peptidase I